MDDRFCKFQIPFEWIFGDRYDKLVAMVEAHGKAGYYFDPHIDKATKTKLKEKWNLNNPQRNRAWAPMGEPINFGHVEYDFDDRFYLALPGIEVRDALPDGQHKLSMARLLFVVTCKMCATKDLSPFELDPHKLWHRFARPSKGVYLHCNLHKPNGQFHMQPKEVSLLAGGNERRIVGMEPISQMCHVDVALTFSPQTHNPNNSQPPPLATTSANAHKPLEPGSFLVPIDPDGRSLWMYSVKNIVKVKMGEILIFKGDLPHGGLTVRGTQKQRSSIHGHLDSTHFDRQQTFLGISEMGNGHYLPTEHLAFVTPRTYAEYALESYQRWNRVIQYYDYNKLKQCWHEESDSEADEETHDEDADSEAQAATSSRRSHGFPRQLAKEVAWGEEMEPLMQELDLLKRGNNSSAGRAKKKRKQGI